MFEAIVSSNGWDGVTAALQLVAHLEGDALNVALLVPAPRRVLSGVLLDVLMEHCSSPGRLADYRRQFERVSRVLGSDPSVFAAELETLALRPFGDLRPFGERVCSWSVIGLMPDRWSVPSVDIWIVWSRELLSGIS